MSKRPGHTITRVNKGHPRRQARRDRAAERLAAAQSRQSGGPVAAGTPYVVGEHGPETFVPTQSGYILPSVP